MVAARPWPPERARRGMPAPSAEGMRVVAFERSEDWRVSAVL